MMEAERIAGLAVDAAIAAYLSALEQRDITARRAAVVELATAARTYTHVLGIRADADD